MYKSAFTYLNTNSNINTNNTNNNNNNNSTNESLVKNLLWPSRDLQFDLNNAFHLAKKQTILSRAVESSSSSITSSSVSSPRLSLLSSISASPPEHSQQTFVGLFNNLNIKNRFVYQSIFFFTKNLRFRRKLS